VEYGAGGAVKKEGAERGSVARVEGVEGDDRRPEASRRGKVSVGEKSTLYPSGKRERDIRLRSIEEGIGEREGGGIKSYGKGCKRTGSEGQVIQRKLDRRSLEKILGVEKKTCPGGKRAAWGVSVRVLMPDRD